MHKVKKLVEAGEGALSGAWGKNSGVLFRVLVEVLEYRENEWETTANDVEKIMMFPGRIQQCLKSGFRGLDEGKYSYELGDVAAALKELLGNQWSITSVFSQEQWREIKKRCIEGAIVGVTEFIKVLGPSASHPLMLKTIKLLLEYGMNTENNKLCCALLTAIGSLGNDLVSHYVNTNGITEKIYETLAVYTQEDSLLLAPPKSISRKIGNSSQRRSHKLKLKKTERQRVSKIQKTYVDKDTNSMALVKSLLRLLHALVVSGETLDLKRLFNIEFSSLNRSLVPYFLDLLFISGVSTRKHSKKLSFILNSLLKDLTYRSQARLYLFHLALIHNNGAS